MDLGLIEAHRNPPTQTPANFAEWAYATFGSGIAKHFFLQYNERVWATPPSQEVYTGIKLGVAAGMAALVLLVWRRTRDMKHVAPLALGLGCVWMTVLGPATEVHTYTLLGPTAAAAVVFAIADRRWGTVAVAAVGWALLISPVVRDMFPRGGPFQAMGPQPVGGVLLLGVIVRQALLRTGAVGAKPQAAEERRMAA